MTRMWITRTLVLLLLVGGAAQAQTEQLPKGVVVERVPCVAKPGQTYALYIPTGYESTRKHPILYCFDPSARGKVPVELYKNAAERLGYIVACSNNSRNGPWEPIYAAIQAVTDDTHARFSIDSRRIYTTGMSGGGGPAWNVASTGLAGSIICASAFQMEEETLKGVSFALFGVAGMGDFNFPLMTKVCSSLEAMGKTVRFETFEGGHAWPPEEIAGMALDWMELQAIKSGLRPPDGAFVDGLYAKAVARAEAFETGGRIYDAYRAFRAISSDFKNLKEVNGYVEKVQNLAGTKEVKQAIKQEAELATLQETRMNRLRAARYALERETVSGGPSAAETDPDSREMFAGGESEIRDTIRQLKDKMESKVFDRDRILAQRVLEELLINSLYYAKDLIQAKNYHSALVSLKICEWIRPKASGVLFDSSRAYAGRGDKKKALEYLGKAVEAGFKDAEVIATTPEFDRLRKEKGYAEILSRLPQQ